MRAGIRVRSWSLIVAKLKVLKTSRWPWYSQVIAVFLLVGAGAEGREGGLAVLAVLQQPILTVLKRREGWLLLAIAVREVTLGVRDRTC